MRTLLVDLDDTLLDYSGGVDECWLGACALVAPLGVDAASLLAAIVEARRRFWSDSDRHRVERVNMLGAWTKITAQALEAIGAGDGSLAGAIAEDFAARRWQRMALFPGVTDALDRLRGRGVTLALVTNGDATHQRRKIQQYGLAGFFDAVLIEGEFGVGKPDPAVYRHVLTTLGADPAETWMVGDHLEWDVGAPQRLGLRGVWVDAAGQGLPEGSPVVPHRIIHAFPELLALERG